MRIRAIWLTTALTVLVFIHSSSAYPFDGFERTGIRRLEAVRLSIAGELDRPKPVLGGQKTVEDIRLNPQDTANAYVEALPPPDPQLQERLNVLFPDKHQSYAVALLDITPNRPMRYAGHQADRSYAPGSVGKMAVAAGLFAELQRLFPDDPEKRRLLLKERLVEADEWIIKNQHPVPIFDPQTRHFESRPPVLGDVFSLYEWLDHMLSASANAAASIIWKEAMLMRAFGAAYPPSKDEERAYFKNTSKGELQRVGLAVANEPLRRAGIAKDVWQMGSFFTNTGQRIVPGAPSYATPRALLVFLLRLEQGRIVDPWSSLEIKRLLYMTAKRIRYASSPAIARSAVYFKSGSLYKCQAEEGFRCGKYMGNVENYMNSVAIVETSDGRVYLVALMSNVLRKNSAVDHQGLATEIEGIMKVNP